MLIANICILYYVVSVEFEVQTLVDSFIQAYCLNNIHKYLIFMMNIFILSIVI